MIGGDWYERQNERLQDHFRAQAHFVGRAANATDDRDLATLLGSISKAWAGALGVCPLTEAHRWDAVCEAAVAVAENVLDEDPPQWTPEEHQ